MKETDANRPKRTSKPGVLHDEARLARRSQRPDQLSPEKRPGWSHRASEAVTMFDIIALMKPHAGPISKSGNRRGSSLPDGHLGGDDGITKFSKKTEFF